jgi:quinol monooxygenase YgiN
MILSSSATNSASDPTQFRVFEIFTSEAAFEEHSKTSSVKFAPMAERAAREGVSVSPPEIQKHVLIEDVEKGIVV